MTQKAYSNGSAYPELQKDTLRLYSSRTCPYAERARLVLAHKNIPHQVVNINLRDKPDWFLEKSPLGKVPVIEHNGRVLCESTAVCEYLDDVFPGEKLQAQEPYRKACDRILLEQYGQVTSGFYGVLLSAGKEEKKEETASKVEQLMKGIGYYERVLVKRGTLFFGGEKPSMLDFYLWPHLERIPTIKMMGPSVALDQNNFPKMAGWWEAMTQVAAVKTEMNPAVWHFEVYKLFSQGKHAGDYGLEE